MLTPSKDPNNAAYADLAALMEPHAVLPLQSGTFTYTGANSSRKYVVASWQTQIGGAGRFEVRNPDCPYPLLGPSLVGTGSGSTAVILDPTLPAYADARRTYFDRCNTLNTARTKYLNLSGASTAAPALPGPYGTLLLSVTTFDVDWMIAGTKNNTLNWNLWNEKDDGASAAFRYFVRYAKPVPLVKGVIDTFQLGTAKTASTALGTVTLYDCPSTWSSLYDAIGNQTWLWRDDFMSSTFNSGTNWTTSLGGAGAIAYEGQGNASTLRPWVRMTPTTTWGQCGARATTGIARSSQPTLIVDFMTSNISQTLGVGWGDGAGGSYTNLAHGFVATTGGTTSDLTVWENNNSRGAVSTTALQPYTTYRVSIQALLGGGATYKIQGGTFGPIGSTFTTTNPGTSSSATSTLYPTITAQNSAGGTVWVGDVRAY